MMKFIPGVQKLGDKLNLDQAEKELKKKEAIINSMTLQERHEPDVLNGSRRARIARGSGTSVQDINRFMKEFAEMRKMMKMFSKGGAGAMGKIMSKFGM
jgi:signal recognition particle subunit SRP54